MASNVTFDILARDRASQTFDKVGLAAQRSGSRLAQVGKGMAIALGTTAVGGVVALGAAMVRGVKEAADYQTLAAKTAAVLKSTGNVAHQSVAGIQARAAALESLSGVDETVIINGQNVLATFTKVRDGVGKGNDIFNQATKASLNLSTALGTDMQSASILVGKALNDPVRGLTALRRAGVSFTAQQQDQIKAMVESGNTMGAQKLILKELGTEFGGAAKAAGQGFNGAMARAKDAVGDAFRAIGTQLLPTITTMANYVATNAGPAIQRLGDWMRTNLVPAIKTVVGAVSGFISNFQNGVGAAGALRTVLAVLGGVLSKVAGYIRQNLDAFVIFVGLAVAGIAAFKIITAATRAWAIMQLFLNGTLVANPIGLVIAAIALLVGGLILAYKRSETFRNIVNGALQAVGKVGIWLWNSVFQPIIHFILTGFASIATAIGRMLIALGGIPGFGWAKTAGEKMLTAAGAAQRLADSIRKIPNKTVSVDVYYKTHGFTYVPGQGPTARAGGGPVMAKTLYQVGEQGPELFVPKTAGTIIDARDTAAIMAGRTGRPVSAAEKGDQNVTVQLVLDGRVIQQSLLRLKRTGGTELGLA